jgi:Zn-dependent protease
LPSLSWNIGRVAGIDLYLHPTFLILLVVVAASQGGLLAAALMAAVFGCVLLHELGHALSARRFYGIQTEDITLYPIGGVARLERMPRKPGPEIVITLAGPLVNVALAGGFALLGGVLEAAAPGSLLGWFARALFYINLALAGFNLIPAFPMDGGRILRAVLTSWLGRLRATEIAAGLGRLLAMGFGAYSLLNGQVLHAVLAGFIYLAAWAEVAKVREEERPRFDPPDFWGDGFGGGRGGRWAKAARGTWRVAPILVTVDNNPRTRRR